MIRMIKVFDDVNVSGEKFNIGELWAENKVCLIRCSGFHITPDEIRELLNLNIIYKDDYIGNLVKIRGYLNLCGVEKEWNDISQGYNYTFCNNTEYYSIEHILTNNLISLEALKDLRERKREESKNNSKETIKDKSIETHKVKWRDRICNVDKVRIMCIVAILCGVASIILNVIK